MALSVSFKLKANKLSDGLPATGVAVVMGEKGSNFLLTAVYTVSHKTCDYIFFNTFNNKCPIAIIFGTVSSHSRRHRKMVSFPTSPI